ncbi:hypothetical protein K461DRAFT_158308 [Myriangium duriaei CBS 260.36]|uniref:Uncharacterized protein n=1 Tax=Myriangium duriaei CBS 260.36 TaxID=1168546 RepID=A0A9P4IXS6_9PEZI|nr:hypothetical protein K461DRAFT_158308 [Myriangium duriaei CBS 260.36]
MSRWRVAGRSFHLSQQLPQASPGLVLWSARTSCRIFGISCSKPRGQMVSEIEVELCAADMSMGAQTLSTQPIRPLGCGSLETRQQNSSAINLMKAGWASSVGRKATIDRPNL